MKSFILLDRSGSMTNGWTDTIGGLNAYVRAMAATMPKTKVTVLAFDSGYAGSSDITVLRDGVKAGDWIDIATLECIPRGGTPLLDAIGTLNQYVKGKKASILILTDGGENSSREISRETAKKIIAGWEEKGYDVAFIGADFDAFGEASMLGVKTGSTLNVSKGKMVDVGAAYASRSMSYAQTGVVHDWSDKDREDLK